LVFHRSSFEFRPHLPARYASAFEKLKPGSYDYVALVFNDNALGLDADEIVFEKAFTDKTARERLTSIRIYEELRDRGYDGSYDLCLSQRLSTPSSRPISGDTTKTQMAR
jgi:hypothetical protein